MNPLADIDGQRSAGVSAAPTSGSGWFRLLVPSVSDLVCISLFISLAVGLSRRLLGDAGIGWHIRTGEWILRTGSVPRVDSFSSLMSGKPWYAWEWLYDILIAAIHQALGLNGVVFYSAAIIAAAFVVAFYFALRGGSNLPVTLFLLVLAVGASAVHFLARPHVVSWLLAVIWFEVVNAAAITPSRENHRRLFWLPALMLLWVNLHGGFLLGFVLLGAYLAGMGIE